MPKSPVTESQIREAAYHLWNDEGQPHGLDQDFWFRAESALTTPKPRRKAAAKKPAAKSASTGTKAKKPTTK